MKWKAATIVLLLAGILSACGNAQEKRAATSCKKYSELSDSVCECIAKKMAASASAESLTLYLDVTDGVFAAQNFANSTGSSGQMPDTQEILQEIASNHGLSVFDLESRVEQVGDEKNNAQAACTRNS